jgi:subtilisin family serine protease
MSFHPVTQIIRARDILPVFAVGNEGPGTSRSPGNYDEVLSVGASDEAGTIADFSSSQRFVDPDERFVPDLTAPGVDVLSSIPGGSTELFSGSSMATPHVAGLAALLFEAFPSATATQIEAAIFDASNRRAGMTASRGGRGIPDGVKALKSLGEALGIPSLVVASTTATKKPKVKKTRATAKSKPKTKVKKKARKTA